MDADGVAHVLADLTAPGLSPEAWARRVADAAAQFGASRVVAEKNQGGDMIASVLRAVDANLPVRLVPATRSKAARAEPIALRFETGRAKLAGVFPELEDQLCALDLGGVPGRGEPGPGRCHGVGDDRAVRAGAAVPRVGAVKGDVPFREKVRVPIHALVRDQPSFEPPFPAG